MRIIPVLAGLILLLAPRPSAASDFNFWPTPYPGEGPFVQGPAAVGGVIGIVPGAVLGGVAGLFVAEPRNGALLGSVKGQQALGHVVGAPFWCLKKVFYDGPRKLAGAK